MKKTRTLIFAAFLSCSLVLAGCNNTPVPEKKFTITFLDEDLTELSVIKVKKGEMPVYDKEEPTKESTAQYVYTFAGWTPEIVVATEDATYTATYQSSDRKYTIKFVNGETELQSEELTYNETPTYKGDTPTKDPEDGYTFVFEGWDQEIVPVTEDKTYTAVFHQVDEHGFCIHCNKVLGSEKIADYSIDGVSLAEDEEPARGFEKVYGKVGISAGANGIDLNIGQYTTVLFSLYHSEQYLYLFGGSEAYATLWKECWYHVLLERDSDFKWKAYYKEAHLDAWKESKLDDGDRSKNNLKDLLKLYNWDADLTKLAVYCSEIYAIDNHEHDADEYGMCKFCGILIDSVVACDRAIKNATLSTTDTAPAGFESVYTITGLSNGNNGSSFAVASYKTLYFSIYHDISYVYLFGGNGDNNTTVWQSEWFNILLIKTNSGWIAYSKRARETTWKTDRTKVDGANDENFSSILRIYNWSGLSSANVKCTEVLGVLA